MRAINPSQPPFLKGGKFPPFLKGDEGGLPKAGQTDEDFY